MSEDKKDDKKDTQTGHEGQAAKTDQTEQLGRTEQLNQTEQLGRTRQAGLTSQTGKNKYKAYKTQIWRPFRRSNYRAAWVDQNIIGILKEFCRDMRRCHQRIWKGYCDYDLYSIYEWFRGIMPPMLEDFKDNLHGYPSSFYDISSSEAEEDKSDKAGKTDKADKIDKTNKADETDKGMKAWQDTLDKMIFLFRESDRETCSHQNPYEEEYSKASDEFRKKYGLLGEKLATEDEKDEFGTRWHHMSELEKYKPISDKYFAEDEKLREYRFKCNEEALALFNKYFYDLWD